MAGIVEAVVEVGIVGVGTVAAEEGTAVHCLSSPS